MVTFTYFAYGSNMLTERLCARCQSAKVLGRATARGYSLEFCKQSVDGSGKATLVQSAKEGAIVHGVLFDIAMTERGDRRAVNPRHALAGRRSAWAMPLRPGDGCSGSCGRSSSGRTWP
jgi:cation transport regulator ChaC